MICRSNSTAEERELLQNAHSREIIQRVADDTSTLRITMSERGSQMGPPTIVSHDDSTIDNKIFDWDDEIVNADTYRRAMQHARSKSDMAAKHEVREDRLDTSSLAGTEESSDRLSPMGTPIISQRQKPLPYEMSVVSEPPLGQQTRLIIPNSSVSEKTPSRKNILAYRQKTPDTDKRSFWSSISGKRSSRSLAPPERGSAPQSSASKTSTPGSRRGRRGFENSYHTSINFASEEGLTAPPIVRAAQAGSVVEVETLLDQRSDINARHVQSGRSALAVAAHCGNEDVVRLLLQYGASVNERDTSQLTPLHLASLRGHVGVVDSLLQEHADIDAKGPNDQTPLHIAAEKGQIDIAEILLRKKARVNARDTAQMTPLHISAKHGDEAMTDLLINNGAHVEAKDSSFMGPIHYACEGGHLAVITILLNKKADLEAAGKASMTPLLYASSSGQAHVVELLLKKKASVKHKGEGEMTALHWASFNGHVEVVDLLLQRKASISAATKDGRTPLHLAVIAQEFAVADLLLRKGASIEAQCNSMLRPIHYACVRAKPEIMMLLLGNNANIEAEDSAKNRPLHNACTRGSLAHVELLIQKGVNIEARNADGDRPLCLASSRGHVEMVRVLLVRGAALRSKFSSGPSHEDSPLCIAAKNGHGLVCQELLIRGTSVLQKDERNWQPLRYAAFNAHPEVVELLLRYGATVSGSASGGWGFNITAQRIGFATDVTNEEHRKGQVLRLLTSAEEREQRAQQKMAPAHAPIVPPAVQNQTSPTELPDPSTAASPAPASHPQPTHLPPDATSKASSEPPYSSNGNAPSSTRHPYRSPHPLATEMPGVTPQQPYPRYHTADPGGSLYTGFPNMPNTSTQPVPSLSEPNHYSPGNQAHVPAHATTTLSSQPQVSTSYNFVPKAMPPTAPVGHYNPAGQYQPMPNSFAPPAGNPGALTMALGPDGFWQQVPNPGLQRVPSRNAASPAPVNYPTGVYEMSS